MSHCSRNHYWEMDTDMWRELAGEIKRVSVTTISVDSREMVHGGDCDQLRVSLIVQAQERADFSGAY